VLSADQHEGFLQYSIPKRLGAWGNGMKKSREWALERAVLQIVIFFGLVDYHIG